MVTRNPWRTNLPCFYGNHMNQNKRSQTTCFARCDVSECLYLKTSARRQHVLPGEVSPSDCISKQAHADNTFCQVRCLRVLVSQNKRLQTTRFARCAVSECLYLKTSARRQHVLPGVLSPSACISKQALADNTFCQVWCLRALVLLCTKLWKTQGLMANYS